jgi:hypothetical protein
VDKEKGNEDKERKMRLEENVKWRRKKLIQS